MNMESQAFASGRQTEVCAPSDRPPRHSYAVLTLLALVAIGLIVLPRPTLYYPQLVIDAPGMQLEFLLNGRSDMAACEAAGNAIANAATVSCKECRTRQMNCVRNPSSELRSRFGDMPLPMPSARMADGIVTYSANEADIALSACQESERQAALRGDQARVVCYPAGAQRTRTAFERERAHSNHTAYTLLLAILGSLATSLVGLVFAAHHRHVNLEVEGRQLVIHQWTEKFTLAGVDALILLGTFLAFAWPAHDDINRWSRLDRNTVIGHGVIVALTIGWFWLLLEHYARRRPFWDELREIFRVLIIMGMVWGAAAFVVGMETGHVSHVLVWALNLVLIPLGRAGTRRLLDDFGLWQRPAVIIGVGDNAREAYQAIRSEHNMGYRVLGFVDLGEGRPAPSALTIKGETFPVFDEPTLQTFPPSVQLIVALESLSGEKEQVFVQQLVSRNRSIHAIPSIRGLPLFGTQLSHFFSHEVLLLTLRNNLARRGYKWTKRAFDLIVASALLGLLSPLFIFLTLKIRQEGGRAFYGHPRIGKDGTVFKCLKFRSMRFDADKVLKELLANDAAARAEWERDFKLRDDPRITPIGHVLRKTSLDELPQLINVLKGEMSLVGPRPIVTAELERYGDYVNLYLQGLPGMTGLWQVSGRNDTSYEQRVALDAWYVQNWSLWYDVAILFKTIAIVLKKRGAY